MPSRNNHEEQVYIRVEVPDLQDARNFYNGLIEKHPWLGHALIEVFISSEPDPATDTLVLLIILDAARLNIHDRGIASTIGSAHDFVRFQPKEESQEDRWVIDIEKAIITEPTVKLLEIFERIFNTTLTEELANTPLKPYLYNENGKRIKNQKFNSIPRLARILGALASNQSVEPRPHSYTVKHLMEDATLGILMSGRQVGKKAIITLLIALHNLNEDKVDNTEN